MFLYDCRFNIVKGYFYIKRLIQRYAIVLTIVCCATFAILNRFAEEASFVERVPAISTPDKIDKNNSEFERVVIYSVSPGHTFLSGCNN